jgi:hypothetical protein
MLDSPVEETFERLTRAVVSGAQVPTALVSLVDDARQFFKSAQGLGEPWASMRQTPLSHSFCQHVVTSDEMLVVEDSRTDPRVAGNLAIDDLSVVAYAGAPLHGPGGMPLGSLCAIDSSPRAWTPEELAVVRDLAALASELIIMRAAALETRAIALDLSHQLRTGLAAARLELAEVAGGARVAELLTGLDDVATGAVARLSRQALIAQKPVPLRALLEELARGRDGVQIGAVDDALVTAPLTELSGVIREMLQNLLDHAKGPVVLTAAVAGPVVRITAKTGGEGLPTEVGKALTARADGGAMEDQSLSERAARSLQGRLLMTSPTALELVLSLSD